MALGGGDSHSLSRGLHRVLPPGAAVPEGMVRSLLLAEGRRVPLLWAEIHHSARAWAREGEEGLRSRRRSFFFDDVTAKRNPSGRGGDVRLEATHTSVPFLLTSGV